MTEFVEILGMESESSCSVLGAHHTPEYKAFSKIDRPHSQILYRKDTAFP